MDDNSWLWGSWQHLRAPWVDPILAVAAIVCGMLVGGERHRREKPAGLSTLALVCLGSAVFTMMSFAFTTTTGDSGRVAAQIVTGVGFLGGGVILHGRRMVSGVTTAAVIWIAAAIGMAVGAGYVVAGLALSIFVNRFLVGMTFFERKWHPDLHHVRVVIEFDLDRGLTRVRMQRVLVDFDIRESDAEWSEPSASIGRLTLGTKLARVHFNELLSELADVPGVKSINRERLEPVHPTLKTT